jgi:DNA-binding protein HU-beta
MKLYKQLLDISLYTSFGLLVLFVLALLFGLVLDAYQFDQPDLSFVKHEYAYLRAILTFLGLSTFLFVVLARVFLWFIQKEEKLVSASDYRKKNAQRLQKTASFSNTLAYKTIKTNTVRTPNKDVIPKEKTISVSEVLLQESVAKEEPITQTETKPVIKEIQKETKEKKAKQYYTRLNKGEIVEILQEHTTLSKYKARQFLNTVLDTIQEELVKGNDVKIDDFGRFHTKQLQERDGINPQTQEDIKIEAHRSVRFTPYKAFKDAISMDVIATSKRYLRTKPASKEMTEPQFSDSVQLEKTATEHVNNKVKKVTKKKVAKPKVPKKTKIDIIEYINTHTSLSKNKANIFLKNFALIIGETLEEDNSVSIQKFGTFKTVVIPEKEGINPATQEAIIVPEHRQVRLKFDKSLKETINN